MEPVHMQTALKSQLGRGGGAAHKVIHITSSSA